MGSTSPVSRITHYRFRSDAGAVDASPTWMSAGEDVAQSVTVGSNFRIRIGVENTGTASDTITGPASGGTNTGIIRCGYADGTYLLLSNVINGADASSDADGTNVTVQRLTSGTGIFATGTAGYDESEVLSCAVANGNFTEVEFGTVLTGGASTIGVGGGETWAFCVGGLTNVPLNVPTFTTPDTNGTNFQHGNQLGGAGQKVANSASISMTTAAAVRAGNLVVVAVTCDNNGTTDGDFSEITGVTYDGIAMTKAREFTNGQGTAQTGVTTSVWWYQDATGRAASKTITATFATAATNGDANTIQAREFVVGSGLTVSVDNTNAAATDGATQPASIDCTTTNTECLRVVAHGFEGSLTSTAGPNSVQASSKDWSLWWTTGALLRMSAAGPAASDVSCIVEANISTGTGKASLVGAIPYTDDWSSVYVAFKAASAANVGAAQGDAAAAAVGASTNKQAGAASGDATAAAVGASRFFAAGAASGDSSAAAVGVAAKPMVGSAQGDSSAAATSSATKRSPGAAQGDANASATGSSTAREPGTAQGDATASAVSSALKRSPGAAQGDSTASGVLTASARFAGTAQGDANASGSLTAAARTTGTAQGDAIAAAAGQSAAGATGAGSAQGDASASAVSSASKRSVGAASGDANASGFLTAAARTTGTAAGDATASGSLTAAARTTGAAAGDANASATGFGAAPMVGTATGDAIAAAVGSSTVAAAAGAGLAQGDAIASAAGVASKLAVGTAVGDATASAVGRELTVATGTAAGDATASAVGRSIQVNAGTAQGDSTASAVGKSSALAQGTAVGDATASAPSSATKLSVGLAQGDASASAASSGGEAVIGFAQGDSAAAAFGEATAASVGQAQGDASAASVGQTTATARGVAAGDSTASAASFFTSSGVGFAQGDATATGHAGAIVSTGLAIGDSTAAAVSSFVALFSMTGAAEGEADAIGVSNVAALAVGSAIGDSSASGGGFRRLPKVRHISTRERIKRAEPLKMYQNLFLASPEVTVTKFQADTFQNDAFDISVVLGGCKFQGDSFQTNAFDSCGIVEKRPTTISRQRARHVKTRIGWYGRVR